MIVFITIFFLPFLTIADSKDKDKVSKKQDDQSNASNDSVPNTSDIITETPEPQPSSEIIPTSSQPLPTPTLYPAPSPTPDLRKVPTIGAIIATCIASLIIMTATTSYLCFKKEDKDAEPEASFSTAAQILLDKKYDPV